MRARTTIAALLLGVAICTHADVFACGDKFVMLGRQTRFERSPAAREAAAVLMYANPDSELSRTLTALSVEAGLKKVGYHPTIVGSAMALDAAARTRKWDVVVVDTKDSQTVGQRLQISGGPHVVPVLTRPTHEELSQAKKVYRTVIDTPTRTRAFLDVIDDAMDWHEAEVEAARKAAKKDTH